MEIFVSIGAKISECLVEPIAHQLGYLFYYKSNVEKLRTQVQNLKVVKDKLQHSIDEANRNGEEIEADVLSWMSRVDGILEQIHKFLGDLEAQTNTRCGQFPDFPSRNRLSRKARKLALEIASEIQTSGGFHKVSYLPVLQSTFDVNGYEAFQSRMSTFCRIMEALRNPSFDMVGVYGMGGVGKTMLCKEVAKRAKEQMLFSKAIMVTISQNPKLENIQQEIAERLGLKLKEKCIPVRADRLRHRLRQEKKILVILDDIWENLELHDIGISFGDDKRGCKILLTSRSQDVLCNDMGVEKNFLVGVLSVREATNLFKTIVGDTIKNLSIQPLATEIIKECAGLPIAIATVANALRKKSLPVWNNALQELRMSTPTNIKGMHEKVYSSIKLSYDCLSEESKSLLLLCGLFHEDANIDGEHLLRLGMGWGLFQCIPKLEGARNKLLTLIEDLKSCCLLLDGDYNGCVKMHDIVRDVVISIASKDRHMYNLRSIAEMDECFNGRKLKDAIAVSLSELDYDCQLPERLEFPKVQLFCMRYKSLCIQNIFRHWMYPYFPYGQNLEIPHHFLEEMKELRVLELNFIRLKPLASCFGFFQNLQTLCLWYCDMSDIAMIGELKNLKILDLSGSYIKELPNQIGQLTHLQLLGLKHCSSLKLIQPGTISNLINLQELDMEESFRDWDVEGDGGERSNASLIELKSLHKLTTLHIQIPDASILSEEIFSEKLERYNIVIGDVLVRYVDFGIARKLNLKLNKSDVFNGNGLQMLLKKSEVLYLNGLAGFNNVVQELDVEGLPQLKHLHFRNNFGIQYIINSMEEIHTCCAFVSLELLQLTKLMDLEKICHGKLAENSFGRLKDIEIHECNKLKNLFSFSIAKGLLQLEKIEVTSCEMMEEIIICERDDRSQNIDDETVQKIQFPQLRTLKLCNLPRLKQFYSVVKTNCRNQWKGKQLISDFAMSFFNKKVSFPKLKNLTLEGCATNNVLWHGKSEGLHGGDDELTCIFSGLRGLTLSELPNLVHVWDENCQIDRAFLNLLSLEVLKCDRLKNLAPSWISFRNLMMLKVSKCHGMVNLLTYSTAKSLPQLKIMCIGICNSMTEIIANEENEPEGEIVFSQLEALDICRLPRLASFYSGNFMMGFPKLKYVGISHCPEMKSFSQRALSTPQLHKLALLDEEWEDAGYHRADDLEWPDDSIASDFDEEMFDDNMYRNKPVQELMECDINTTIRHLWERDQIGLALQQLFTEEQI
ncbi:disease resistance protein At4g27190 isoform X2 [Ziziphus jujuba]|uniref:Disease resistance protein At4g27190 isoform X2 n=1 Tax=Ziziphus jujuba TaxID=326968 RepID=A0ABM3IC03_ZIZJJ|nr:disease resistance protein At4g27190 isoform X2 [Ziziphus jujuba]